MIKVTKMMPTESQLGMRLEYLVTKPSKKPAANVKGKVLINILTPSFTPVLNDVILENVFGNRILAPKINPAAPSMTIAKISIEP